MNTQANKAQVSQETIRQYWEEAFAFTQYLQPEQRFSTPEMVTYLNEHLPPSCEPITKTKVNYLRDQGILHPLAAGGEIRTSWRYTPEDARKVLLVELLKTREDLNIQEIKGWLVRFEEALQVVMRNNQGDGETKRGNINTSSTYSAHSSLCTLS